MNPLPWWLVICGVHLQSNPPDLLRYVECLEPIAPSHTRIEIRPMQSVASSTNIRPGNPGLTVAVPGGAIRFTGHAPTSSVGRG